MTNQRSKKQMLIPTIVLGVMALAMFILAWRKDGDLHIEGLKRTFDMTIEILPLLFFAFIVAGFVQVLLPQEMVAKWVGVESGWKGIFIGCAAGGLSPGGPFVSLPIAAGLVKAGAGVGTMVAYLTAWSLWAVSRLPMEVGVLGWKLTLIRLASTFVLPPIAGFMAQALFGSVKL